jgi:hypothetical protein
MRSGIPYAEGIRKKKPRPFSTGAKHFQSALRGNRLFLNIDQLLLPSESSSAFPVRIRKIDVREILALEP